MKKKNKYAILIKYLPNYTVKYCFYKAEVTDSLGGGWYEVVDYRLMCSASILKAGYDLSHVCEEADLPPDYFLLYQQEKESYENSVLHKSRIQSFNQKLINYEISSTKKK